MTPLYLLNFFVLQWFGVRLQAAFTPTSRIAAAPRGFRVPLPRNAKWWSTHVPSDALVTWSLLRWVWPLTGWWSECRWIAKRGVSR